MKLIILDRDGVINFDSPNYIKSPDEWIPIPGSLESIARLNQEGYCVSVATNQSGIARGFYDVASLDAIHHKMQEALKVLGGHIDTIFYCPHAPEANCECRKPKPGMFLQIAKYYQCDLINVPAVGDSLRDIQAAQAVECEAILVLTGNGKKVLETESTLTNVEVVPDLAAYVNHLVGTHG
jgi:D-glycero-D-manno-heptose 1,7-bisphosphate phosphatase